MPLLSAPVLIGTVLAVLIGVALGLLGGGGSIMTLPILVYVIGVEPHEAIALSLLVVGATSMAALVPHARGGRVAWRAGGLFGAASMVGAYLGGKLGHFAPATLLLLLFTGMMVAAAIAMMRPRSESMVPEGAACDARLPLGKAIALGVLVGAFSGLVGAGGGFLVVPALVVLGKMSMRQAVGTSLMVIAMNSFAAFAGYLSTTHVNWGLAAMVTSAAVVGSVLGGALAGRVPQELLRRGFAWFVLVMAMFMLSQEVPRALGFTIELSTAWPLVATLSGIPLLVAIVDLSRRVSFPAPAR
jgi:uncharacterized membrane protein YfcA